MSQAAVTAVRSVDLAVPDLSAARAFFADVWNLHVIAEQGGIVYFRAAGPHFHVLSLRASTDGKPALVRVNLEAADRAAVDTMHARIVAEGQPVDGAPRVLTTPGGGYGFGFKDPEGRNYSLACGVADHKDRIASPDTPAKLSHVNLNCRDNDATFGFLARALGFKLSDQTRQFRFIRCNTDHHSLVLGFTDNANLNHIAYEIADMDALMRGIGRMRDNGYPVEWGPGRHGPGNNIFAYFCGYDDMPLEYTGEMEQVGPDFAPSKKPEEWTWPKGRLDHWGLTPGPSAKVKAAQARFQFAPEGHQLDA